MKWLKKKRKNKPNVQIAAFTGSITAEQFRTIRTNIEYSSIDKETKSLMITSASAGDGKTTTSSNLAVVFAQQGKKVLLIDTDLRKPSVHKAFSVSNTIGLTGVLSKRVTLEQAIISTPYDNLCLLTSGPIPPNPSELLASKTMQDILQKLHQEFDIIILDTPPVLAVADAQILAKYCDGVILVVSSGKTLIEQAKKAKQALQSTNACLLGIVLNNKSCEKNDAYYYYGKAE